MAEGAAEEVQEGGHEDVREERGPRVVELVVDPLDLVRKGRPGGAKDRLELPVTDDHFHSAGRPAVVALPAGGPQDGAVHMGDRGLRVA